MQTYDIRNLFPYLKNNEEVYLDSAATSLKLQSVIDAEYEYMSKISANPHSTDFDNAFKSTQFIEKAREENKKFINAFSSDEIIFTSGTTHSINQIAFGFKKNLKKDDEIVITKLEHSSNMLPWIIISKEIGCKIKYLELNEEGDIIFDSIKKIITGKTKIVSFASSNNTLGATRDVPKIIKEIKKINNEAIVSVDVAQTIAHKQIDVQQWGADFVSYSMHKLFGPFGLGILWGKKNHLENLEPIFFGGGNNVFINKNDFLLKSSPDKFEAGTPNISAIYSSLEVFKFFEKYKFENLLNIEKDLKKYIMKKFKNFPDKKIKFWNLDNEELILIFDVDGVDAQDVGNFLSRKYNISVRSGNVCAKQIESVIGSKKIVRASFSIYNNYDDVDKLYDALLNIDSWIEVII